jgi:hypothetical protein
MHAGALAHSESRSTRRHDAVIPRAETKTIATMGWGAAILSAACGYAGAALGAHVGAAVGVALCGAVAGLIVYRAGTAQNSSPKRCLYLQFTAPVNPPASGTYKDSRCK